MTTGTCSFRATTIWTSLSAKWLRQRPAHRGGEPDLPITNCPAFGCARHKFCLPQTPQRDRHFWRLANVLLRRRQGRDNIKIRRAIIARDGFVELAASYKPGSRLADIAGGDGVAALQASNATSGMTGDTIFIDAGPHNMG
jgi:hypothetical protein